MEPFTSRWMAFLFYFAAMNSICFNGKVLPADQPVLLASNRGYRYGDGLFETMKVIDGKIQLASLHFDRLFSGLNTLDLSIPKLLSAQKLEQQILHLCGVNDCTELARVRLSFFRGNGGLYDEDKTAQYIIECWPLQQSVHSLNENGLIIDIFPGARKSCDMFSNLKSANFLPYSVAANYAKKNQLNDAVILNTTGAIADSTIANIFIVKNNIVRTPGLDQGCVNGVMRRQLLISMQVKGEPVSEGPVSVQDLLTADELFLSNAINGIRWVRQCGDKTYSNTKTIEIYKLLQQTIKG